MRIALSAITAFFLASTAALACDDHVGKCEIEDWNYSYTPMMKALTIDGVATCDAGEVRLRLYDGEGDTRKSWRSQPPTSGATSSRRWFCLSRGDLMPCRSNTASSRTDG